MTMPKSHPQQLRAAYINEAETRWRASAAYGDMMAALEAEGWPDYETANAYRLADPARWSRFQCAWERAMQRRIGMPPWSPAHGSHGAVRSASSPDALRMRGTRGTPDSSARRRRGAP